MIKAVIFDRDGVLIDSEAVHLTSIKGALAELGVIFDDHDADFIIGRTPLDYKEKFIAKYHVDWDQYITKQKAIFTKLFDPNSLLIKESVALALALKREGLKLGLATSGGKAATQTMLEATGLLQLFEVVVAREDCNERKPSPESYLLTAKKLGVSPDGCIAIEDTSIGLEAAKRAGMKCIALKTSLTGQNFTKADLIISRQDLNFERIKSLIED